MISLANITECLLNARQHPRCWESVDNKTDKSLLSLDFKSSWGRQTVNVVKININVAGGKISAPQEIRLGKGAGQGDMPLFLSRYSSSAWLHG